MPADLGRIRNVSRIRPGFPVSARMLRGKGKPFPYNEMLRIRRMWCLVFGVAAGVVEDADPYKTPSPFPSPARGRKGEAHSGLVGGGVPTPRQQR